MDTAAECYRCREGAIEVGGEKGLRWRERAFGRSRGVYSEEGGEP